MTIEEIKKERVKLEAEVGALITSFEGSTGVTVTSVDLDQFCVETSVIPIRTEVKIKLEI